MRTFKEMNKVDGEVCPICETSDSGEVVLIGIIGTEEGNNIEAKQFHLKCINLVYDKSLGIIFQRIGEPR